MKQEYRYLGVLKTKIMKKLWKDHQYTRKELCDMLDIAWTTMFDNLNAMKKRGIVEKIKRNNGKRGSPPVYWFLTQDFITEMESEYLLY